jgi:hypothetical protein
MTSGSAAVAEGSRRFPPPWTEHAESFWVQDASGQTGWFYFRHHEETARQAKVLTRDEAARTAMRRARLNNGHMRSGDGARPARNECPENFCRRSA